MREWDSTEIHCYTVRTLVGTEVLESREAEMHENVQGTVSTYLGTIPADFTTLARSQLNIPTLFPSHLARPILGHPNIAV